MSKKPAIPTRYPTKPESAQLSPVEPILYDVQRFADPWTLGPETVTRKLGCYQEEPGFKDWGSLVPKKHKRSYRIFRVHADILRRTESE